MRYKDFDSPQCPNCHVKQDVEHVLLHCQQNIVKKARSKFLLEYKKYVGSFSISNSEDKIKEILNIDPKCRSEDRENAIKIICMFIKSVYKGMFNS